MMYCNSVCSLKLPEKFFEIASMILIKFLIWQISSAKLENASILMKNLLS
jgi:hypothetical protein